MIIKQSLRFIKNLILWRKEYLPHFKKRFLFFGKDARIEYPSNIPDAKFVSVGDNTTILKNSRIQVYNALTGNRANVTIGHNCYIGSSLSILAGANVEIGDDVLIASNVLITSEDHGINPESEIPYMNQPLICKPVKIGSGTWIGEKVSVLPGVTIGQRCIIGTSAVVTKDIPDFCLAVGIPARIIKRYSFKEHKWLPYGGGGDTNI